MKKNLMSLAVSILIVCLIALAAMVVHALLSWLNIRIESFAFSVFAFAVFICFWRAVHTIFEDFE